VDVQLGGVEVPAGTPLFFVLRPAMLDSARFHEAWRFEPERWLRDEQARGRSHDARAFLQFGAGPRACSGRNLATMQSRMQLSMLVRNFHVELAADPETIREVMGFTMAPDRVPVRLHVRN
jgi:cytochrome P450